MRSACGRNASYTAPPPMTQTSSYAARTSATDESRRAPSAAQLLLVVRTTLVRSGRGRNRGGSDSHVRRPITTVEPRVRARNSRRSSGSCQGSAPPAPMTPPVASRARSHGHRAADRRVVPVVDQVEVLVDLLEQRRRGVDGELREGQHL